MHTHMHIETLFAVFFLIVHTHTHAATVSEMECFAMSATEVPDSEPEEVMPERCEGEESISYVKRCLAMKRAAFYLIYSAHDHTLYVESEEDWAIMDPHEGEPNYSRHAMCIDVESGAFLPLPSFDAMGHEYTMMTESLADKKYVGYRDLESVTCNTGPLEI